MVDNEAKQSSKDIEKKNKVLDPTLKESQERLREMEETLEAIVNGAVDGLVRHTPNGNQIFILKGSEEPYRQLIEEMAEGAIILSDRGTILYSNIGFAKLIGTSLDKIIGKGIVDWVSEASAKTFAELMSNVKKGTGKRIFDIAFQTLKKQIIPTQVSITKIPIGSINASALIITDLSKHMEKEVKRYTENLECEISERKKAEETLRHSEKKYRDLTETTSDFVWEMDTRGRYTYCSPQMEKLWKIKPSEMIGKSPFDLMPEEAKEKVLEYFTALASSPKPFSLDAVSCDGQGSLVSLAITGVPFFDDKGKLLGFRGITRDITERKKAQEDLRVNEERFRFILANSPIVVATLDRDLRYTWVYNPLGGFKPEDILGKKVGLSADSKFSQGILESLNKVLTNGEKVSYKTSSKTPTGEMFFETHAEPLRNHEGEITGVSLVYVDVSDREKAEEELAAAQAKLQEYATSLEQLVKKRTQQVTDERKRLYDVLETTPAMICLLTPDHHVAFANRSFRERFGESKGRHCYDFCFGNKEPCTFCETYKVLETGQPHHWELNSPDGRVIDAYDFPFKDMDGSPMILEMDIDITDRRKAEEQLRASSSYSRNLIEASLDPLVTISADGKINDVNKATEMATGCSREELIGSDFSSYFTDPEKAAAGYKQVFTEGFVTDYPLTIKHKSGRIADVLYNAVVYLNDAGDVQGVFAVARDITERKELERQLKDSERLAAIGATASMVGHDIRNPLQGITSDVYLLRSELESLRKSKAKSSMIESLDGIDQNVQYVNKIVQDLQDFARPIKPTIQEVVLEDLCENVLFKKLLPENIDASCQVEPNVNKIFTDPELLKRILSNLVNNAIQAMPKGGKIAVNAYSEGEDAVISVEDTGGGIPEDVKPKMFTPLFTTKSKGQGFGLAVVKRVTESLGGTVYFESEVGKGTKFIVRLPQGDKRHM